MVRILKSYNKKKKDNVLVRLVAGQKIESKLIFLNESVQKMQASSDFDGKHRFLIEN